MNGNSSQLTPDKGTQLTPDFEQKYWCLIFLLESYVLNLSVLQSLHATKVRTEFIPHILQEQKSKAVLPHSQSRQNSKFKLKSEHESCLFPNFLQPTLALRGVPSKMIQLGCQFEPPHLGSAPSSSAPGNGLCSSSQQGPGNSMTPTSTLYHSRSHSQLTHRQGLLPPEIAELVSREARKMKEGGSGPTWRTGKPPLAIQRNHIKPWMNTGDWEGISPTNVWVSVTVFRHASGFLGILTIVSYTTCSCLEAKLLYICIAIKE